MAKVKPPSASCPLCEDDFSSCKCEKAWCECGWMAAGETEWLDEAIESHDAACPWPKAQR